MTTNAPSLVADIGGTNTRLALVSEGKIQNSSLHKLRNRGVDRFEDLVTDYLQKMEVSRCGGVAVAMAGPVMDGAGTMTNLGWTISAPALAECCGVIDPARAHVLNDLQAQGLALDLLEGQDLMPLLPGTARPGATRLVIGIGTGFNCAPVYPGPSLPLVPPSESGHATLPARTASSLALRAHYEEQLGFVAIEDILSGRGLARCDAFIRHRVNHPDTRDSTEILAAAAQGDDTAREGISLFSQCLADVTGDLALIHLPYGGIVFAGGLARAIAPFLTETGFADALYDKGRFSDFLRQFPLSVLQNDYAALLGAARLLS